MSSELDRLDAIVHSIERSHLLNLVLWLASFIGFGICAGWVMWGGPVESANTRAEAIAKLWPMAVAWLVALGAKSKITGDQKAAALKEPPSTSPPPEGEAAP